MNQSLQSSLDNGPSTHTSGIGGSASLKGKLLTLEETVRQLTEELAVYKNQVHLLKQEKQTLETVLTTKIEDVRKGLFGELNKVEVEMNKHFTHQKAENGRLQQQITTLKGEKTSLEQQLMLLQRRINELESQVGE